MGGVNNKNVYIAQGNIAFAHCQSLRGKPWVNGASFSLVKFVAKRDNQFLPFRLKLLRIERWKNKTSDILPSCLSCYFGVGKYFQQN